MDSGNRFISVWELSLRDKLLKNIDDFEVIDSLFDQVHRQKAQRACFTLLKPFRYLHLEKYFDSAGIGHCLTQYLIPEHAIIDALYHLDLMNIRYGTLFPDVEGAAIDANTSWIMAAYTTATLADALIQDTAALSTRACLQTALRTQYFAKMLRLKALHMVFADTP